MAKRAIPQAPLGMHHFVLSCQASVVASHVAAGHLEKDTARSTLLAAAQPLIEYKYCNCSLDQVTATIDDAFAQASS